MFGRPTHDDRGDWRKLSTVLTVTCVGLAAARATPAGQPAISSETRNRWLHVDLGGRICCNLQLQIEGEVRMTEFVSLYRLPPVHENTADDVAAWNGWLTGIGTDGLPENTRR